jgi:hypothetical protein
MRYLHRVQMHEKFIASGTYKAPDALEQWSIHEQPGGTRLVRIDMEKAPLTLLLEAWVNLTDEGRVVERIDLYGRSDVEIRATYNFFDDHVQIGRTINGGERRHDEFAVNPPYIGTFADSLLLYGYAVARAATTGGDYTVISPKAENAFAPETGRMKVKPMGEAEVKVGSKPYKTRQLEIDDTYAYLDANDVLIALQTVSFQLLNYARRPA